MSKEDLVVRYRALEDEIIKDHIKEAIQAHVVTRHDLEQLYENIRTVADRVMHAHELEFHEEQLPDEEKYLKRHITITMVGEDCGTGGVRAPKEPEERKYDFESCYGGHLPVDVISDTVIISAIQALCRNCMHSCTPIYQEEGVRCLQGICDTAERIIHRLSDLLLGDSDGA